MNIKKTWQGRSRIDTLNRPQDEQDLILKHSRLPFNKRLPISTVENIDALNGALLQLHIVYGGQLLPHASAVMVAPGVALTASHTFTAYVDASSKSKIFSVICLAPTEDKLILWKVRKMNFDKGDLCLLELDLMSNETDLENSDGDWILRFMQLSARPPLLNEKITILGFRSNEAYYQDDPDVSSNVVLVAAQGKVTATYPNGRDSVMLPFPSFEIDCPALGAMSGGPAFDERGQVVGVLSSSFEGSTLETGGPSYAAWVLPALPMKFEGGWPPKLVDGTEGLISRKSQAIVEHADAFTCNEAHGTWRYNWN